jgi:hypothetical protein
MRKDVIAFGLGIALTIFISFGFKTFDSEKVQSFIVENHDKEECYVPTEDEIEKQDVCILFTGKTFIGFKQALASKESLGSYDMINAYGYMGKYQFGKRTLKNIGIYDFKRFLTNPIQQEIAFEALLRINKWELRKEIKKYSGAIIKGVLITESGLLAAAHLGGASSVKKFLKSNGTNGFKDGFGTSIKSYIRKFKGFDTSDIKPDRFAKVNP